MRKLGKKLIDSALIARFTRRWSAKADRAPQTELSVLRKQAGQARALRRHLDKLIYTAEDRLALPRIGSNKFSRPHNTDWSWRPQLWRAPLTKSGLSSVQSKATMGDEVTIFHDCSLSELGIRQIRNLEENHLAPYGLRLEVYRFDGSFLSLVLDLQDDCVDGMKRTHVLRVDAVIEMEKPIEIFARLNIRHGPNTEQMVQELPLNTSEVRAEFDLAYSNLNEKRVEKAWIDLIFEGPEMNQIMLRDLTFSRRPRAQL